MTRGRAHNARAMTPSPPTIPQPIPPEFAIALRELGLEGLSKEQILHLIREG